MRRALLGPPVPRSLAYLWRWFGELDMARGIGEYGLEAITYMQIDAWARLTNRKPLPHEVQALTRLDRAVRFPGKD